MMASYPPLEAYRRDLARLGNQRAIGANDGKWLTACLLLQRFGDAPTASARAELGGELAHHLASGDGLTILDAALRLATEIDEAGALNLAASWLHLLERIIPNQRTLDVGRIRAHRALVARKLGAVDSARDLYREIEEMGERAGEPELTARAWLGYALLAHMRGNYPEARRWYHAAAVIADDRGCSRQSFHAHQGLLICAAVAGEFDSAMVEGWRSFLCSTDDPNSEAEVLSNMAQVLFMSGRHSEALRGFAAAVARGQASHILLGAIGGVALAASALGRPGVVGAAAARVERLAANAWAYPLAVAWLDLSDAYASLGNVEASTRYRERARELSIKNAFHELVHRADETKPPVPDRSVRADFGSAAQRVLIDIDALYAPPDLCAVN